MVSYAFAVEKDNDQDFSADLTVIKYRWTLENVSKSKWKPPVWMTLSTLIVLFLVISTMMLHH